MPGIGPTDELTLSPAVRDRYDQLVGTVQQADGLSGQWRRFTRGAADATRLVELLGLQDTEAAAAAKEGSAARYAAALTHLDKADAAIAEAKTLRDRLRNAADVQTLDRWLERNETWDAALRELYRALQASGGKVTDDVRAAFADERAAFARLPADTKPLIIIMYDVAQGGLNQAVIAIEEARGSLEGGVDAARTGGRRRRERRTEPHATRLSGPAPDRFPAGTLGSPSGDRTTRDGRPVLTLPEVSVRIRVVTDQPWDVKADVLAIPIVGEPEFDGPLGELDRRTGGELRALATFGELRAKRFSSSLAAPGESARPARARRSRAGDAATVDREVVHRRRRLEHRLGGRHASSLAVWLTPARRRARRRRRAAAAELVARGVVEGSFDPKALYRDDAESRAAGARRADPRRARRRRRRAASGPRERGVIIGEGANHARSLSNRSANDVSPEVLADEARAVAKKHGLWIDVIEPERAPPSSAWACSSRSGGAATTRRG